MTIISAHQPQITSNATLLFFDDFNTLDLVTPSNPNGVWRPDDFWQNLNSGYIDFAGTSFNLNPNSANTLHYNPFSVAGSILSVQVIRTSQLPAGVAAGIPADIVASGQSGSTPAWCGGILIQNGNRVDLRYTYGYFEWKARWSTVGKGMFPALWLYNANGGPKTDSELDVLERFGTPNTWTTSLHISGNGMQVQARNDTPTQFHLYAVDWQPTYIDIYEDNVQVAHYTSGIPAASEFNVPMGGRINYAMDANWFPAANKSDGTTPSPMVMEVDWFKIWNKRPF